MPPKEKIKLRQPSKRAGFMVVDEKGARKSVFTFGSQRFDRQNL